MRNFKNSVLQIGLASILLCPGLSKAQVQVLGFEMGKSTTSQVKTQLAKQTKIQDGGMNKFTGGTQFTTDGSGYDIDDLSNVVYIFDKDQKLAGVLMTLSQAESKAKRFDALFSVLTSKYKVVSKKRPFVGDMSGQFKGNGTTILLTAPHLSFEIEANYLRDDLFQKFNSQTADENNQKKSAEKSKF
jgi:hypothetical protein